MNDPIERAEHAPGIWTVTLAGAGRSGFVDTAALADLAAALTDLAQQPGLRAIVLRGNDAMFCRGRIAAQGLTRASDVAEDLRAILRVNAALDALPAPVIAAVEGEALGFGFGLAAQADIAVAGAGAEFALPEMSHGLPPLVVLSYLLRFVPYKRAVDLAITSRRISAAEAREAGIVTEIVPDGRAVARALERAAAIALQDPQSVTLLRRFARRAAGAHAPELAEHAVAIMSVLLSERAQTPHA